MYAGLKTKKKIISINKDTSISSLMGNIIITKQEVIKQEGDLKNAMVHGKIVLLD
jgi:hypothetical protein